MVGPISDEERSSFAFRVKVGITVLIGVSAGLITLQGDPSLPIIVGAVVGGLVVGGLLVWYLFPDGTAMTGNQGGRRR
jgi:membrane associated rhomboid family serine protease